ncbi:MAG: exodeoxyribonuclease VII large subunit [Candidatus Margulisbacteria bacterium]|nr:exodeoxyribonuclease VII large subunit [Candidatus Margulisiibacteriota bacterium]
MNQKTLTVSQLTKYIKSLMTNDMVLSGLIVKGEISNFKEYKMGGTWYFTLKDELAQIRCVIFASVIPKIKFKPEDGMTIIARGKIGVFEKRGEYNLQVFFMEPEGVGAEALALEQLKKKLLAEGLFEESRKKTLPSFPKTVGVVTSPSGAAVHDVITVAKRRDPSVQIIIIPAIVQGMAGPPSVIKAIENGNNYDQVEVLIIARGGGASEELAVFNDEGVARAIANSRIPVVSAVGHEVDVTIADLVADKRAPTPSAAAELTVPDRESFARSVQYYLDNLKDSLLDIVKEIRQRIESAMEELKEELLHKLEKKKDRLSHAVERLELLNPLLILKRGYSVTIAQGTGKVVTSARQVKSGDRIETRVEKGTIESIVE